MTPGARVAAAIEILDDILGGAAPEKALTGWGRGHRFAGSKDRAAIRDHVFSALRCRASFAWLGGAETGRGIMLGAMRDAGHLNEMFNGEGHAPTGVNDGEEGQPLKAASRATRLDMPDWILPHFDAALGDRADEVLLRLKSRAGVFLRVNAARSDAATVQASLAQDSIGTEAIPDISFALQVTENERRVALSTAYISGRVEVQDTSSQVAIMALGITEGQRILDYCAGGGGKSLAMAALGATVSAYDIDPRRMVDLGPRADRAGVEIATLTAQDIETVQPFDLVLCDAPCSGSGTWRRTPAAKWDLTPDRLVELANLQDDVLRKAAPLVAIGGTLAYATCSVFEVENDIRIQSFLDQVSGFEVMATLKIEPHALGDGFYLTQMRRRA